MRHIVIDVSTAPISDAGKYLEGTVKAPSNYGPDAAAKYIEEKQAERLEMAGLDLDLARVTGIGLSFGEDSCVATLLKTEQEEARELTALGELLNERVPPTIVTYNGHEFDLPLLMRRARYLNVPFPKLNLDRYRSPHRDLCLELTDRNPKRLRSLLFYSKRLGWSDIHKPLSGAEEAQVPVSGRWEELATSLEHDVRATYRLGQWMGILAPSEVLI